MNCSVVTPNQKSGETVSCQWSLKTRTSASKSTRKLTSTSGLCWTVMLIPCGLNRLTLSWTITRCWHSCQMTEFHWLPQWDFCLKFQTWRTLVPLPSQEAVCFSSTSPISDGDHLWTVGWTDPNPTWRTRKTRFQFITHQSTKWQRQCSLDASNHTLKHHQTCTTRQRSLILHLHQPWVSSSRFAQSWTVF